MKVRRFDKEFTSDGYANNLDELDLIFNNLGLDNLNGKVITLDMPSGIEMAIPHNLKRVPKYRIILRKSAIGEIIDGVKSWTSQIIYLKNTGASTSKVTMLVI